MRRHALRRQDVARVDASTFVWALVLLALSLIPALLRLRGKNTPAEPAAGSADPDELRVPEPVGDGDPLRFDPPFGPGIRTRSRGAGQPRAAAAAVGKPTRQRRPRSGIRGTVYATLTGRDLWRILELVQMMNDAPEGAFLRTMLAGAAGLVSSDTVSYNEHDTSSVREERYLIEPDHTERTRLDAAFHRHLGQHPVMGAISGGRLAAGGSVAVSDLLSGPAFRRLPLYREYFRLHDVEDQLAVLISAGRTRSRVMVLSRSRRGFSARDRAAVEALAPHVRQALRHRGRIAQLRASAALRQPTGVAEAAWASLTPRELDVIGGLASGATDHVIGRRLGISGRTVGKHLENIYRKLDVSGRTELLAVRGATPPVPIRAGTN